MRHRRTAAPMFAHGTLDEMPSDEDDDLVVVIVAVDERFHPASMDTYFSKRDFRVALP
jgi:hypothetical protein